MGMLTRGTIISEGMLIAGRDDVASRANVWLQQWLNSVANSWPWPQLKTEVSFTMTAGTSEYDLGGASGKDPGSYFLRILDNMWIYTSDKRVRAQVRVMPQESEPATTVYDTTIRRGLPERCRLWWKFGQFGVYTLQFDPCPDQAYLVNVPVLKQAAQLTSDGDIPWYPNDATMIQFIAAETSKYDDGPDSPAYRSHIEMVSSMVRDDRMRYGSHLGMNDRMLLDTAIFR
jgi:hypothetical protein